MLVVDSVSCFLLVVINFWTGTVYCEAPILRECSHDIQYQWFSIINLEFRDYVAIFARQIMRLQIIMLQIMSYVRYYQEFMTF